MEFGNKHRFSSSFSDFITRYTAVSSTNKKTETAEYYALEADDGRISTVTSMQILIDGRYTLKDAGKNPRLAQAKSKNDKNISGLLNQIEAGKIGIHTFTNVSIFTVEETDAKDSSGLILPI